MTGQTELMYSYWGKARIEEGSALAHLLPYHALDVAACGAALLHYHSPMRQTLSGLLGLPEPDLKGWTAWFLAIHDLGKFSAAFQQQAPAVVQVLGGELTSHRYSVRHDSLGWALWQSHVREHLASSASFSDVLDVWARCVTGHHGQPPSNRSGTGFVRTGQHFTSRGLEAAQQFIETVGQFLSPPQVGAAADDLLHRAEGGSWWLAGLAVLADWLGSNPQWFPYCADPMPLDVYWARAQRQAAVAVSNFGGLPVAPAPRQDFVSLFKDWKPTPLQSELNAIALAAEPQLLVIEDVTGAGKTEAALLFAHRLLADGVAQGLFWALPTMATANALYDRMRTHSERLFAEPPALILTHGNRALVELQDAAGEFESATARASAWLADSNRRALLAQVGVGTVDQVLLAALHARHGSLRLLGLIGKVLVIDEVHAYDAYMTQVLSTLLELHARAGGSVVLMSATMPQHQRQFLADAWRRGRGLEAAPLQSESYPLVTLASATGVSETTTGTRPELARTVEVVQEPRAIQVAELIRDTANSGRCVCWIRNTVADALEAYQTLKPELGERLRLFHARFTLGDRLAVERDVLRRFGKASTSAERAGRVLIATQVVEQSLDLDFDLLVSDLAPIDLLIQRAGRLHRHVRGDRGHPVFVLHGPPAGPDADEHWLDEHPRTRAVYPDRGRLWLSAHMFSAGSLRMPEDARRLTEVVYGPGALERMPPALAAISRRTDADARSERLLGRYNALPLRGSYEVGTTDYWRDEFTPTRLGDPTRVLVLAQWDGTNLTPMTPHPHHPWATSAVSVRANVVSDVPLPDSALRAARASLPVTSWQTLLPLQLRDGLWQTTVLSGRRERQSPLVLYYDRERGLRW